MKNYSIFFTVITLFCMSIVTYLSLPGSTQDFARSSIQDLLLHGNILPNFLILITLLWVVIWFVIPSEIRKLKIVPLFKLKADRHLLGFFLVILGVTLQFLIIVLPSTIASKNSFPVTMVVIIVALLSWWIATFAYCRLPIDYKKCIMFFLGFTMIALTVLQSLTYFIKF